MSGSKRLLVVLGVKALVAGALPNADTMGLEADDAKPDSIGAGGTAIVRSGDPGPPEIDLSPVSYNYEHDIPIELGAYEAPPLTSEEVLDAMMRPIGAAVAADRTLGGLVDWLEVQAPSTEDFDAVGAVAGRWANFSIVASYATSDPLN